MPAISILTPMLPVPRIDGRGTHTFMSTSAHTGDATAAGMSIPRGLGGIDNGRGVRTVEPGLAHKGMRTLLVRARCATPATTHQGEMRVRLKHGIGGSVEAIQPGNGIKDDVLLRTVYACLGSRR